MCCVLLLGVVCLFVLGCCSLLVVACAIVFSGLLLLCVVACCRPLLVFVGYCVSFSSDCRFLLCVVVCCMLYWFVALRVLFVVVLWFAFVVVCV